MKIVILAGGQQSTLNNDYEGIPKPMAEIAEKPILWHIMKSYSAQGYHDFIICGGYKINLIKDYFTDFYIYQSDITVDLSSNKVEIHKKVTENWNVTIINTGLYSTTGQRVSMIKDYVGEENFIVTYGDCLTDICLSDLEMAHKKSGKIATLVVTKPSGRNVLLPLDLEGNFCDDATGNQLSEELNNNAWISAYTMVFQKKVFDYLIGNYDLEKQLFLRLSEKKQMITYQHKGFWSAIETTRDRDRLEALWNIGKAPWKNWHEE